MANFHRARLDKEYLDGGTWKCVDSPTGAHHWIITNTKHGKDMKCKYCPEIRHLNEDVVIPIYGKKSKK